MKFIESTISSIFKIDSLVAKPFVYSSESHYYIRQRNYVCVARF